MRQTAFVTALALSLAPLPTPAQAEPTTFTFETVDSFTSGFELGPEQYYGIEITGIVQGESTPRTIVFPLFLTNSAQSDVSRACERMALLVMNKPGQYLLRVRRNLPYNELAHCSLSRVQP